MPTPMTGYIYELTDDDCIDIIGLFGIHPVRRGKGFQKYLVNDITTPGTEVVVLLGVELGFYEILAYYKNKFYLADPIEATDKSKYTITTDDYGTEVAYLREKIKINNPKRIKSEIKKFLGTMTKET